eukprot:4792126-Amphidinium_carterae.1
MFSFVIVRSSATRGGVPGSSSTILCIVNLTCHCAKCVANCTVYCTHEGVHCFDTIAVFLKTTAAANNSSLGCSTLICLCRKEIARDSAEKAFSNGRDAVIGEGKLLTPDMQGASDASCMQALHE